MEYDAVIIGTGRVGLPLGLSLAKNGLKVTGIDINEEMIEKVNNKEMPFKEKGYEEVIKKVNFEISSSYLVIKNCKNIIITVGTPLAQHIEIDLQFIKNVINKLIQFLEPNHNIILRSTIAPNTTEYIKNYIEKETDFIVGKDIFLSFCPERIAEGKALEELEKLPQIIGAYDNESFNRAKNVFKVLVKDIIQVTPIEAELIKLFCNATRYMQFSVVNYLAIIADNFNTDIHKLLEIINKDYPRPIYGKVGFCAGTCLRKDYGMLNEYVPYSDMLISAYKINEFMPKFLVDSTKKYTEIKNKNVAVLGYAFKRNSDDTRDSLSPKLVRYLEREVPQNIYINDPYVSTLENNIGIKDFINKTDIVYIVVNHDLYEKYFDNIYDSAKKETLFVDLWNVSKKNKIFFTKE